MRVGNQCADDARGKCAGGEANGVAGGLAVASAAADGSGSSEDAELSVEGLGLADLLAGALAAYRAI